MNLYFLGILAALVVFFAVGIAAGRMVKDTTSPGATRRRC